MTADGSYDLIILGGGISGTVLALNILNQRPQTRIAILEKSTEFPQKIGESSSDITALILKKLNIDHILCQQKEKTGLRFIFNERNASDFSDTLEFSSPAFRAVTNGFHINRKIFDQQLLDECEKRGATVFRPVDIEDMTLIEFSNTLRFRQGEHHFSITSRWLTDASGRARVVSKKMGWKDLPTDLQTGSVMTHFKNILPPTEWHLPQPEVWKKKQAIGSGDFSTVHFMRPNAWWWFIRIDDETTSVGMVFDKHKIQVNNAENFLDTAIRNDAQLNHILGKATRGSVLHLEQLAYCSEKLCDKGLILIGDSGGFVDPLVSPGIELILQQSIWVSELLIRDFDTQQYEPKKWKKYDRTFRRAAQDRMSIYQAGYRFIQSHDLFRNWLRLGLFAYFGITVFMAILFPSRLKKPVTLNFLQKRGLRFIIWRLNRINARRIKQGRQSKIKTNAVSYSKVYVSKGIKIYLIPFRMFFAWLFDYIKLELGEVRYLFRSEKTKI